MPDLIRSTAMARAGALTRRDLVAVPLAATALSASAAVPEPSHPVPFSPEQSALLDQICSSIIPTDQDPGAHEAKCVHYIEQQLGSTLQRYAVSYREGLPLFASTCRELTGHAFGDLDPHARAAFLEQVEKTNPKGLATFFAMVVDHTMQGFYGAPEHGGNHDEVSWKMLGVEKEMSAHNGHEGHR